jgi:hypothetical protein
VLIQLSTGGNGVGVTSTEVTSNATLLQSIIGIGVGVGSQSQSKYALKSNVVQFIGNGVGDGQIPTLKSLADISGQLE